MWRPPLQQAAGRAGPARGPLPGLPAFGRRPARPAQPASAVRPQSRIPPCRAEAEAGGARDSESPAGGSRHQRRPRAPEGAAGQGRGPGACGHGPASAGPDQTLSVAGCVPGLGSQPATGRARADAHSGPARVRPGAQSSWVGRRCFVTRAPAAAGSLAVCDGGIKPRALKRGIGILWFDSALGLWIRLETRFLIHKLGWCEHLNDPDTALSYLLCCIASGVVLNVWCSVSSFMLGNEFVRE